jgi:ribosomal protein S7
VQIISFLFSLQVYLFALRTYSTEDETDAIQHYHKASTVIKVIATRPLHILLRHFVKTKPLFQLISKRFGSTIINIPTPLSSNRQLLTAVRLCARDIKVFRFANNLEHQIYMYLISCMSSGRTS